MPTSLSSDLDIKIYVKNVNDHEPQFLVREFQANFTENLAPGRERVRIVGTIDRDDIDEEDLDEVDELREILNHYHLRTLLQVRHLITNVKFDI